MQKELDAVHGADYHRILDALRGLGEAPRPQGCEKLYDSVHRIRVGDWRIIYLVDDAHRRVEVGGILRRNEHTYRRIEDLFA